LRTRLQVVRGFQADETKRLCARINAGTTVVSDGGQWFRCIADQPGINHERHVTGSDRAAARHAAFRWTNTMLANIKNSLSAAHRAVSAKHLPRYLGSFAWRFNRRFALQAIHERLAVAATTTPPMPYRLLKLAEARW
jgi:ISXO2-like transposase domain